MESEMRIINILTAAAILIAAGCATVPDHQKKMIFMDRETVDDMSDEQIVVNDIKMKDIKKRHKNKIAILLDMTDQTEGRLKLRDGAKFMTAMQNFARTELGKVKAYNLAYVDASTFNSALKTGDAVNGVQYEFLCRMNISLTAEEINGYDTDIGNYICRLQWELIDNRTKINGLGDLELPSVKETLICQDAQKRKLAIMGVSSRRMGGDSDKVAQEAFNVATLHCLFQFNAQLANRVPFGAMVGDMKILDGNLDLTIKGGVEIGITKNMQMLISNEDLDSIAVGTVMRAGDGKSRVRVWRWLSPTWKKQMLAAASSKEKAEEFLDGEDTALYVVSLGMPRPPKDVLIDAGVKR